MRKNNFTIRITEADRKFLESSYEKDKQKIKEGAPGFEYGWLWKNRSLGSYLVGLAVSHAKAAYPPEPPAALEAVHPAGSKSGRPGTRRPRRHGHSKPKLGSRKSKAR
jgi:hypothetical protein